MCIALCRVCFRVSAINVYVYVSVYVSVSVSCSTALVFIVCFYGLVCGQSMLYTDHGIYMFGGTAVLQDDAGEDEPHEVRPPCLTSTHHRGCRTFCGAATIDDASAVVVVLLLLLLMMMMMSRWTTTRCTCCSCRMTWRAVDGRRLLYPCVTAVLSHRCVRVCVLRGCTRVCVPYCNVYGCAEVWCVAPVEIRCDRSRIQCDAASQQSRLHACVSRSLCARLRCIGRWRRW